MDIPASVDLSAISDIKEYANQYFSDLIDRRYHVTTVVCVVKATVNEKLQEKTSAAYENVAAYAMQEAFAEALEYDYEIRCFKIAVNIFQLERNSGSCIFETIEYIEDFCKIFEKTIQYFLRIQLGLTKSLCIEAMAFFRSKKISVIAVSQMLLECKLGEKEKIALALINYYMEQNLNKEALYLVSSFENQAAEAYKKEFALKKMEINDIIN